MTEDTIVAVRVRWALSRIGEMINEARAVGWLPGQQLPDVDDSVSLLSDLDGLAETPLCIAARRLNLGRVEVDVLWLLACIELEPSLAYAAQPLIAPGMSELSVQMVERLAELGGHPLESQSVMRLVRLGLVESSTDTRLTMSRRPIRARDRVLTLVRGVLDLDPEVAAFARLSSALDERRNKTPDGISADVARACSSSIPTLIVATGVEGAGRATALRQAISSTGRATLTVDARQLSSDEALLTRQLRALVRECQLHGAWPLLCGLDALAEHASLVQRELLDSFDGPVFATTREPFAWRVRRATISVPMHLPDEERRVHLWQTALTSASSDVIRECAQRYRIAPGMLIGAAEAAVARVGTAAKVTVADVHLALRSQLEQRLTGLATRIETRQTWNDLVLPVDQFDLLIELVARVKHRTKVLETWGFADKVGRGVGLSALFSGPPGTGKTMVAGLIAKELGLDLYQVDLSRVVSKYIGETEKQLATLFEAAESGHAILLFDEADSLFGKRTEVKSSNDRYANLEVNYLLQRMEAFNGITLLTTNHEAAIDKAFARRLAFHVRVPMPDQRHRELLWRSIIPEQAECDGDLDIPALAAEFEMAGGYIKNAVVRAAYLAADEGSPITRTHLRRAAHAEYDAMGKVSYQAVA